MSEETGFRFYISSGLLTAEHVQRIGTAVWEFMWLISHETREAGKVLNGSPITAKRIATELGRHPNTVHSNLERLAEEGYVNRVKGIGNLYSYQIANSKKWKTPESQETVTRVTENCDSESQKTVKRVTENCDSNKESRKLDRSRQLDSNALRVFVPPSLEEVGVYCTERRNSVDPAKFHDFYSSKGWYVGRNKMRDWHAAVRTWEKNNYGNEFQGGYHQRSQVNGQASKHQQRVANNRAAILTGLGIGPMPGQCEPSVQDGDVSGGNQDMAARLLKGKP